MKPLFVVPSLVARFETQLGRLDVEGPVPHDKPLVLLLGQDHEPATPLGPLVTMGLSVRAATVV